MFSRFGRQIFSLYEKRPLLMNSIVGGIVYTAGEYTVQTQTKDVRFFDTDNWKRLAQIGTLGAAENGIVMLKWYEVLNRALGSGVSTHIVLAKCLLDQIFFATQQDIIFLGLSAYSDTEVLSDAINEVKETFLTTWIVDCSLWPVVNFIGFAFVPYVLQPTYMAFVSYFWQLYLSATASNKETVLTDHELETLFHTLDTDNSNYIDDHELKAFFQQRNITVTSTEIDQMIADADLMGRELHYAEVGNAPIPPEPDDGKVSLEEFKMLATHGIQFNLKSSALWSSVRQDIVLTKGVKHAMKRLEGVQKHREVVNQRKLAVTNAVTADKEVDAEARAQLLLQEKQADRNSSNDNNISKQPSYTSNSNTGKSGTTNNSSGSSNSSTNTVTNTNKTTTTTTGTKTPTPPIYNNTTKKTTITPTTNTTTPYISPVSERESLTLRHEQHERANRVTELAEERQAAIEKASVGGVVLLVVALFRKLVLKI